MSHREITKKPDAITMSAILLLKSRLQDDTEVAKALNRNIPKVGSTIEITAECPFEAADIERVWEHMASCHRAFVHQMVCWPGDELVRCGVNFIVDGSLKYANIPTVGLEETPRAICDYAVASLGDQDSDDSEADEILTRWMERSEKEGW
ncbi:hypothetical protein MMC27_006558 [Xylographa pallens]|nr:hypothetical protein [Xylographa pallens]